MPAFRHILLLWLLVSPVIAFAQSADTIIKQYCKDEWPENYRMQSHCQEQQREGAQDMADFRKNHDLESAAAVKEGLDANEPPAIIVGHCIQEWPNNFRMQAHCKENQVEAGTKIREFVDKYELNTDKGIDDNSVAASIFGKCSKEWPQNYRMMDHCIEQQVEAARSMGKDL